MDDFTPHTLRPEIEALLRRLRRRIRQYVMFEGAALVLVVLTGLFWISLAVDWVYFQASALELPVWFRKAAAILMLCSFVLSGTVWIALRSLKSIRRKALALLLERRFPELNDRLITAVEAADSYAAEKSPVTSAMLSRTVDDVTQAVGRLDLGSVFDEAPLRRAVVLAVVLLTSVAGLAWAHQPAVARWTRAYLQWEPEYWNRDTHLIVKVLAQPGDRVVPFQDGQYKHPRGADLTVLIEVPAERPDGSTWKIPERVELAYELADGCGSGRATCFAVADEQLLHRERAAAVFRYSTAGLLAGMEFTVRGGDFASRTPLRVVVVDPPRLDRVELDCDYPPHTGLNDIPDASRVTVDAAQVSLPVETRFVLHATANKPLVGARVLFDPYELAIQTVPSSESHTASGASRATLIERSETGRPISSTQLSPEIANRLLSADRRAIAVPWELSHAATEAARGRIDAPLREFPRPFVLAPDTEVRIYLEDADGVIGIEPAQITVNGVVDAPPVVETELRGIGTSITRQATIPVAGLVSDDYGLRKVHFDFRVDDEAEWRARPLGRAPASGAREFRLGPDDDPVERFQVLPLDLAVGRKLTLTVFAEDADELNGPHGTRGPRHEFQIVSAEDLLAILYAKELNLRQRFEQLIGEVESIRGELQRQHTSAEEAAPLRRAPGNADAAEKLQRLDASLAAGTERNLHQSGKNAGEARAIQAGFEDILRELVNNAVHTRQMVDRIDGLIVQPLGAICDRDFPRLDDALRGVQQAHERRQNVPAAVDAAAATIENLLARMRQVLGEMEDLAEFHEALQDLQLIIGEQEQLRDATKSRHKRSFIKGLKDLGLEPQ